MHLRRKLAPTDVTISIVANRIEQSDWSSRYCKMGVGSPYLYTIEQHTNVANDS